LTDFFLGIGLNILLACVGFFVLIKSADFFVDGAASVARNFKISTTVVGLTIVAFGTSAPELAISFSSHISGNADILFGNVIGSNITNILVILGAAILIKPFEVSKSVVKIEIPILMLVTIGMAVLLLDNLFYASKPNVLTRTDGIMLLLLFSVFVFYLITIISNKSSVTIDDMPPKYTIVKAVIATVLGLLGIILGSELVVSNAVTLAVGIGISQKIISVTIISIGTSLPELATVLTATRKGENSIAIGSMIGSNIFNTCIVLGLPIVFLGGIETQVFGLIDMAFMVFTLFLLWMFSFTKYALERHEGAIFLGIYALYLVYIFLQ